MFALGAAGVGALVAVGLRQSLVLGYIAAGLFIGPYTPGIEADGPAVEQLADIGVILLMFAIGVQLSLPDLLRVGRVATGGALLQVALMIAIGYGVGLLLGWDHLEALFFGAVISNSSSTVMSKVLGERGEEDTTHGRLGIAWSTVQDLSTIVLVVVLSSLAEGDSDRLVVDVAGSLALAALYLAIVIPIGWWLLPRLFNRLASVASSEVFVLGTTGVALGIAYLGQEFGISVALGAFVAGILVARSDISHEVLGQIAPIRDIFSGLFFVSVGMLIDPRLVIENLHLVLIGVVLIVVVKGAIVSGFLGALRYSPKTAILTGVVLGQSAEFSFLLARVGTDTGAISSEVFGLMLGSAAVSIVAAPLVLRAAHPLSEAIEARTPGPDPDPIDDDTEIEAAADELSNHAIICGYGNVGRIIHKSLLEHSVKCMIVEQDAGLVQELRDQGHLVIRGNAANRFLLDRVGIPRAWCLVVAIPDPLSARQVVSLARAMNPDMDIVVRTHSSAERTHLEQQGANEAVFGQLELALEMSRHALRRYGVAQPVAERVLTQIRFEHGGRGRDVREDEL